MRYWKVLRTKNPKDFTVGKIYESDNKGYGIIGDDGFNYYTLKPEKFQNTSFVEVFNREEDKSVRRWKCVEIGYRSTDFTVGKIYESDNKGYNIIGDDGYRYDMISACYELGSIEGFETTRFEEVKEEKKMGNKFVCIENYLEGIWLTKGKIYERDEEGFFTMDDGYMTKLIGNFGEDENERKAMSYLKEIKEVKEKTRKWKCLSVNYGNRNAFTVGKIYETDDNGYGVVIDNGNKINSVSIIGYQNDELKFEEIKEGEVDMNNLKVGDKVRVISEKELREKYKTDSCGDYIFQTNATSPNYLVAEMREYCGEIVTISKTNKGFEGDKYGIKEDDDGWYWSLDMFRPLSDGEENSYSIHITRKGNDTIGVLKVNDEVVSRSKAMLSPEDEYDFNIGSKLAYDRLMGIEKGCEPKKEFVEAKVGDIIRIIDNNRTHIPYVKNGDVFVVRKVEDRKGLSSSSVTTDRNVFYSKHEEYEIIGHTKVFDLEDVSIEDLLSEIKRRVEE